ncbi:MAG TPA: porin [Mucilaginibacter sp.]
MKKVLAILLALGITISLKAQDSIKNSKLTISGYAEIYYGHDFNNPQDHNRPAFVYSFNRTNEVTLNLGFIKAAYANDNVRANVALMAGTYANANLAAEPGVFKNIYEANAGIKLSKKADLWLDAGIFSSHIGFESAIGKDCWTLTRSLMADNTPFYESGAKVTYNTADGKFSATGLFLNGWQRIRRQDGNNNPAGGVQLTWKPTANLTLNYSNYLGTEGADSVSVKRFYNDIYAIITITRKLGITAGLDYGTQQKVHGVSGSANIVLPVLIARYQLAKQWAVVGRYEYYKDKDGIFIAAPNPEGFSTSGYSLNVDYSPFPNTLIRLEGKTYSSKDEVFVKADNNVSTDALITGSIAVAF